MKHAAALAAIASTTTMSVNASAQVVYSHFVGAVPITGLAVPGFEFADYITLAGGPAALDRIELKMGSYQGDGSQGTLKVTLYSGAQNSPGAQISSYSQPVTLVEFGPQIVTFDLGGQNFPASGWVGVVYTRLSGNTAGIILETGAPTVGTASASVFRPPGVLSWTAGSPEWLLTMRVTAVPLCSANCDGSTTPPILNVNDFVCFQSLFASGSSSANCDGSTSHPVLNVNDFVCFQSRYAAGCP